MKLTTAFKNTTIFILLFFSLAISADAQRLLKLTLSIDGETQNISYLQRRGNTYVSAKELAKALSANYYYNTEASKLELKFNNYNLKVTGRNQFVVLVTRKDFSQTVFQLPVSTLLVKDDVLIPVAYTLKYVGMAFGREITYDNSRKHIAVSMKPMPVNLYAKEDKPPVTQPPPKEEKPEVKDLKVASKYDVYDLVVEEKSNGTLIRLKSQKDIKGYRSSIKNNKLFLFLNRVTVDPSLSKVKTAGLVRNVARKNVSGNIQLEFDLKEGYSTHETFQDIESKDLIITVHNKMFNTPALDFDSKK